MVVDYEKNVKEWHKKITSRDSKKCLIQIQSLFLSKIMFHNCSTPVLKLSIDYAPHCQDMFLKHRNTKKYQSQDLLYAAVFVHIPFNQLCWWYWRILKSPKKDDDHHYTDQLVQLKPWPVVTMLPTNGLTQVKLLLRKTLQEEFPRCHTFQTKIC